MTTRLEPHRAQEVTLDVPGPCRIAARVERVVDGGFILSTATGLALDGEQRGVLEFATPRGLCRLEGFISDAGPGLDMLEFRQLREPALEQRRDFARADVVVPVRVWIDGEETSLYVLNVSANGMLVNGGERLGLGDVFSFEIDIDDEAPLTGHGRVVRADGDGLRGVALVDVPERDRDRLVRFVFDRHRRERLVRRS